ncbi:MAG: hypothetical protein ACREKN_01400 [Longimicrobiaceae bacterium]
MRALATVSTLALALLSGCGDLLSPDPEAAEGVVIRVELVDHAAKRVDFRVVNRASETAFLASCGGQVMIEVDREGDTGWTTHSSSGPCPAIYEMSPLALKPGKSLPGERGVSEPGRYRLRAGVAFESDQRLEWTVTSDPFDLR